MIPTIGTMIGGYIIFRCLEALCRNESHFGSSGEQKFIQVMAVIGILVTGYLTVNLMTSGAVPELPSAR